MAYGKPRMRYLRDGIGSSHRALEAEREGRVPSSKISALLDDYPVFASWFRSKREAKAWIMSQHGGEWHHTSKYGNKTAFYDVAGLAETLLEYEAGEISEVPGLIERERPRRAKRYPDMERFKNARQSFAIFEAGNGSYALPAMPNWVKRNLAPYFNHENRLMFFYEGSASEGQKAILESLGFAEIFGDWVLFPEKIKNLGGLARIYGKNFKFKIRRQKCNS